MSTSSPTSPVPAAVDGRSVVPGPIPLSAYRAAAAAGQQQRKQRPPYPQQPVQAPTSTPAAAHGSDTNGHALSDDDGEGQMGRAAAKDEHRVTTFDTSESDSDEEDANGVARGAGEEEGEEEEEEVEKGGGRFLVGTRSSGAGGSRWETVRKVVLAFALSLAITAGVLRLLTSTSAILAPSSSSSVSSPSSSIFGSARTPSECLACPTFCPACPVCDDAQSSPASDSSSASPFAEAVSRSLLPLHLNSFLPSLHKPEPASCQPPPLSFPLPTPPAYFTDSLRALGYPLDPLPQCTLLSYNLTLNLLHYVRYVQIPHNQADCSDYSRTSLCTVGGAVMAPRWLLWSVDQVEGGGGYADRMKGLMSTFLIALFARRAFAIDNPRPLPWTDFWQPNVLPWLTLAQLDPALQGLPSPHERLQYNYMGSDADQLNDHNVWNDWEGHPLVRMRHNGNSFPTALNNGHMRQPLFDLGIDRTSRADLDYYLACFMQVLLKPAPLLQDALNAVMGSIGRPLYSSIRPALAAHQALAWYTSLPSPGNASIPLFCAQIRMGNGGRERSFTDSEQFISTSDLPRIFQQLQEQVLARMKDPKLPYYLFVTSDSSDYQPLIAQYFPSPPAIVLTVTGAPFHIDKTDDFKDDAQALRSSYLLTIASFHLLGECDMALLSRSGFGTLSQFRMRQNKRLRRQMRKAQGGTGAADVDDKANYSDLYFVENGGGQLADYRHVRGGDGRERGSDAALAYPPADDCEAA